MKRHYLGPRTITGLFRPRKNTMALGLALSLILLAPGGTAMAQCTINGTNVNCVAAVNNSNIIGPGNTAAGDGWTINVGAATEPAMVTNNGNTVFSVHDNSTITINNYSIVQGNANAGSGLYNTGPNVIEFNSGTNVYIGAGAVVQQLGNTANGEALNAHGNANTITNYGTIHSDNGAALWFQDTYNNGTGTRNTVVNHGTISTDKGAGYNVFGSSSGVNAPGLVFENYGTVQGSLRFGNGNDSLLFGTGSYISGNVDGGGGTNDLTLDATTLYDSATLAGSVANFTSITKTGAGSWAILGGVPSTPGDPHPSSPITGALNNITALHVQQGLLSIVGAAPDFTGAVTIDGPGTMDVQAQAVNNAATMTNNGTLAFNQPFIDTYSGPAVTGVGQVVKLGAGDLVMSPKADNTYSGGTRIQEGALVVDKDSDLGAATGLISLGTAYTQGNLNGTLKFDSSFDLSSGRAITLQDGGGTINTQSYNTTISQAINGAGVLTKLGSGTLTLTGSSSYQGGTLLQEGAIGINSDAALGAADTFLYMYDQTVLRLDADVANSRPVTLFGVPGSQMTIDTQAGTGTFNGVIDGNGALNKTGSGTLVLTGNNLYRGGTIIQQGTLAINSDKALGQPATDLTLYNQTTLRLDGDVTMTARPVNIGNTDIDNTTPNSVTINTNGHRGEIDTVITEAANAGSVRLDKTGSGVLALYGANAYNGGTWVRQDTLAIKNVAGLGGGSLYLGDAANLGTLRADANFGVSGQQIILNSGGGAINTNGFNVTLAEGTLIDPTGAAPQTGTPGDFHKTGNGVLTVLGNQTYTRGTYVDAGTFRLDAVDTANPMANTKGLINTASMNISAGARLEGQGLVGTAGALTTNSGTIAPGLDHFTDTFDSTKPDFISLTLNGDYTATPGAVVEISTQLVDDASQHGTLVIRGVVDNGSEVTGVRVIHDGGSGATTDRGIEIIRILGTADHAAEGRKFALISDFNTQGRAAVVAGAFAYVMEDDVDYLNSTNPNLTSGIYLRNAKRTDGSMVINPSTPLYESYSIILGNLNRLPTLEQRVGHRNWLNSVPTPVPNDAYPEAGGERAVENRAAWVRLEGGTGTGKPDLGSSGGGDHAKYDLDFGRLNFGIDMPLYISDGGSKLIGGLNLNFGQSKAKVTATQGGGAIKTKNEGVGATLTWYADNGFYADAQGRYNWFDTDIRSNVIHAGGDQISGNDGDGYALSLELGRIFNLNDRWSLTPQTQLTYSVTSFDSFTDAQNTLVINEKDYKSLEGRLGLALNYENTYVGDSGEVNRNRLYGLVNYYREFKGDAMISVSTVGYKSEVSENWVGLAVGGSRNWGNDQFSVYGELGARSSTEHFGSEREFTGELGLRVAF